LTAINQNFMTDPRIVLEPGASVPVFRQKGGYFEIDPPGQFYGAVLRTEECYESWHYPPSTKDGQPIAKSQSLAEAVEAFEAHALTNRIATQQKG
jgi:hypothetical protein